MHKHVIIGFAAALAVTGAALAAEKTMNLSRKAKSGVDSLLAYSSRWTATARSCRLRSPLPGNRPMAPLGRSRPTK